MTQIMADTKHNPVGRNTLAEPGAGDSVFITHKPCTCHLAHFNHDGTHRLVFSGLPGTG